MFSVPVQCYTEIHKSHQFIRVTDLCESYPNTVVDVFQQNFCADDDFLYSLTRTHIMLYITYNTSYKRICIIGINNITWAGKKNNIVLLYQEKKICTADAFDDVVESGVVHSYRQKNSNEICNVNEVYYAKRFAFIYTL